MKPIFIGGCPRSGTTLLGALLGAHSRGVCVPEMPFKFNLMLDLDWEGGGVTRRDVDALLRSRYKFGLWGISPGSLGARRGELQDARGTDAAAAPGYRPVVQELVRAYAREVEAPHADFWVDHTPYNVRHGQKLLEHFPDASLVHIVRDGRGVAASILDVDFGPNSVLGSARLWAEWLAHGLAAEMSAPKRVFRVHFEDLVAEPVATMRRLCDDLRLETEEQMGRETEFRIPAFTYEDHARVAREPDRSRAGAWRTSLSSRQIELFESTAGDLLRSMGYSLEFGGRARRASTAEKLRSRFRELIQGVGNRLRHRMRRRTGKS